MVAPTSSPGDRATPTRRAVLRGTAVTPLALWLAGCSDGDGASSSAPSSTPVATTPGSVSSSPSPKASASAGDDGRRLGRENTLTQGLAVPWSIVFLPGGDALVSMRDTGEIVRITPRGTKRSVGTVPGVSSNADQGGEGGLLGLALHPRFRSEPWLYAYHSTGSQNVVVRMRYDATSTAALGRPQTVLDGIDHSLHHNGGGLAFGPDGHLYVSTGDAENKPNAQDKGSLNGKVLRLTDRGQVPSGNPFKSPVWTYGHRNVEGLAFDDQGQLWASEFGDQAKDELNRIDRGADYGWPEVEGADGPGGYHDPIATWATDDCSPSGVTVVGGRAWLGALQGECVYSVVLRGPQAGRIRKHVTGHGRVRAVAAAPDGSLWVGTSNRDGRGTASTGDDRLLRVPFA